MAYNRKDHYYLKAKKAGYASRAAYKLVDLNKKFKLIKRGMAILDLGCSPGGFLQVLNDLVGKKGKVIGIDILPIQCELIGNIKFIHGDFNNNEIIEQAATLADRKFNIIISDASPNITGIKYTDSYNSYELVHQVLEICKTQMLKNGSCIAKTFRNEELNNLRKEFSELFNKVSLYTPPSSRKESSEVYLVGLNLK